MNCKERNALNERIAVAMGWKREYSQPFDWYSPTGRGSDFVPNYDLDPATALEAAAKIMPCGFSLDYHKVEKYYEAECSPNRLDGGGIFMGEDDEPGGALVEMIIEMLDAREEKA